MSTDRAALPTLPSGLDAVDAAWGGLRRGATYLLVGHARAGRATYGLQIAHTAAEADGGVLLVSGDDPQALVHRAATLGFDLPAAYEAERATLLRVPPAPALAALGDDGLTYALDDLARLVRMHRPACALVEDFTAFLRFQRFSPFAEAFQALVAASADAGTALVLALGEPATPASEQLLSVLERQTSGTIRLVLDDSGKLQTTLRPNRCNFEQADCDAVQPEGRPASVPEREGPGETEAVPDDDPAADPLSALLDDLLGSDGLRTDLDAALPDFSVPDYSSDAHTAEMPFPPPGTADLERTREPSDEPPSSDAAAPDDEVDWAAIAPVDPSAEAFEPRDADPFAASTPRNDLFVHGHYLDSNRPSDAAPDPALYSGDGLAGSSAAVHAAAYPELFIPEQADAPCEPQAGEPLPHKPSDDDPAEAFRVRLDAAFRQRQTQPFLVLGLRLDPTGPFADLFALLADALYAEIGPQGALYGDGDTGALVALLPGVNEEAARPLFAAVKARLLDIVPGRAEEALRAVNAMVVPDGAPFDSAEALLRYALDA